MGYPNIGNETNEYLLLFPAKFIVEITHSGLIEVQQQAYFGNSGGPLVDPSGSALGTCEEEAGGNNLARYMPSASAKTLIELIPLSPRMQELDDRFRAGLERNELVRILTKASDTPTNLELYL